MFSVQTGETFIEEEPTTAEFIREVIPNGQQIRDYFWSLFPFLHWIGFYNGQWLAGDLVAGITVGAVVVPQGMAYAILANLPPQFGLYSSFMGVLIYWFFATSKDITIGPVAVMSTIVGNVVSNAKETIPHVPSHYVASALAILAGSIVLFIGLIRCGWIVNLISLSALSAFMTGSAINIAVGQVPTMMGITGFSTREASYKVFIHTLQGLPRTKLDAAMGLTTLFMLYSIRSLCKYLAKRNPQKQKMFFFLSTLRTVFVILLYTMISWLANRGRDSKHTRFKILLNVPRGFQNAHVPMLNSEIASAIASDLPASVIVLLIEHIAISKSFGRVNNYTINPSQEMVAIGVTNLLGPFLGGYPATGSFSRTAIKSKAGVRTPFAGVITAVVVLLAIYALPAVFYYIPSATLSAVIIHAVGDLITPPNTLYQFWRVSPIEVLIFFVGVFVTVFSSIENGIYATICISAAVLLFRILLGKGTFLGRVKVHSVVGDQVVGSEGRQTPAEYGTFNGSGEPAARNVFLPLDHKDGTNPGTSSRTPTQVSSSTASPRASTTPTPTTRSTTSPNISSSTPAAPTSQPLSVPETGPGTTRARPRSSARPPKPLDSAKVLPVWTSIFRPSRPSSSTSPLSTTSMSPPCSNSSTSATNSTDTPRPTSSTGISPASTTAGPSVPSSQPVLGTPPSVPMVSIAGGRASSPLPRLVAPTVPRKPLMMSSMKRRLGVLSLGPAPMTSKLLLVRVAVRMRRSSSLRRGRISDSATGKRLLCTASTGPCSMLT